MNYGLDPYQLLQHIIRPVLLELDGHFKADSLMLGTAMQESELRYLVQKSGPAQGLWQMEPATHKDCWDNYLGFRLLLAHKVRCYSLTAMPGSEPLDIELIDNLRYACAMARIRYKRVSEPLPSHQDARALASYWKHWYNTPLGKGNVAGALPRFQDAVNVCNN